MRMSEKCRNINNSINKHNNSDNPLTSRCNDGGKEWKTSVVQKNGNDNKIFILLQVFLGKWCYPR